MVNFKTKNIDIVFDLLPASRGFTAIYGSPGSGKTSVAAKLADKVANRILWISTNEPPGLLKEVFMRVGARADRF